MVAAGQLAKLLSVVMVFVLILRIFSVCDLNPTEGILIACVQAVCLLVFAAAAGSSAVMLFSRRDDKAKSSKYILNILVNIFAVYFSVCFDMFQFWGV